MHKSEKWAEIRIRWERGESAANLGREYGVTAAAIRVRASRVGWISPRPPRPPRDPNQPPPPPPPPRQPLPEALVVNAPRVARQIVRAVVKKLTASTEARIGTSVDDCVRESITLSQRLMASAANRITAADDGNLSGLATAARTGVDIWRKSLGLDTTGSSASSCAISFAFVMRSADGTETLRNSVAPDAMEEPVTLEAELVQPEHATP